MKPLPDTINYGVLPILSLAMTQMRVLQTFFFSYLMSLIGTIAFFPVYLIWSLCFLKSDTEAIILKLFYTKSLLFSSVCDKHAAIKKRQICLSALV